MPPPSPASCDGPRSDRVVHALVFAMLATCVIGTVAIVFLMMAPPTVALPSPPPTRLSGIERVFMDGPGDLRLLVRDGPALRYAQLRSAAPVTVLTDVPEGEPSWVLLVADPEADRVSGSHGVWQRSVVLHIHAASDVGAGIEPHRGKGSPPAHPIQDVQ